MSKVYVLLHDRDKKNNPYPATFYEEDAKMFHEHNAEGWGVYCAVNDFEATPEQMKIANVKTKRNIPFLQKINAVFADLDIAKAGDGQTRAEKEAKKETLLFALYEKLPPSRIIDTSNGIQPLWDLKDSDTTPEYQSRYVAVINAIIEWSKQHGAMGDAVKDVTRIIRLPGYDHMKEEPYPVTSKYNDNFIYTLDEIEAKFPPVKVEATPAQVQYARLDDLSCAIDMIDFQDLIRRAFASIGRSAEFDNSGRLILDGRQTGTFQGRKDDRNYLASSSHEPFKGNRITAVADIKGITNKEARAWIIEEFGLKKFVVEKKLEQTMKPVEPKPLKSHYSWGTKELAESIAPIKRVTYAIVGGAPGTGKTPFCVNLALENVKLGHRVLYLSLEMTTGEIFDFLSRKHSGITIPEEIYRNVPEEKKQLYLKRKNNLENMENFVLKGIQGGVNVTWDCLVKLMEGEWDLIIIDNFNLIQKEDGVHQIDHEKNLSKNLLAYTAQKQTPIVIVHHYSKGGAQQTHKSGYSLSGSTQIYNDAQRLLLLSRKHFDEDAQPTKKEKAELRVYVDKGRAYDSGFTKVIYFHKGVFVDTFVDDSPQTYWQDKI